MADEAELERLRARVGQLEKINRALMNRVERSLEEDYESFRTFQQASTLERLVRERTSALEQTQRELEQTNASLRTARDAAEQAAEAKSRFLANMSHEIRTPLNGLIGLLRLIDGEALPPEPRNDMRAATRSAEYLLTLLNDVLDLSRLEAGCATTDPRPFELAEVGDALTELFASQAAGHGLTFEVSYPEVRATAVVGDARLIRQALVNLLGNAFKFTTQGRISLALSTEQREGGLWARFVVEDTGVGIAPDVLARLFKPFSQADASTTRVYGGSGLGLAITRDLAQLLGGAVHVESEPGRGSRFTLEVPVTAWLLPAPPEAHVLLDLDETDATRRVRDSLQQLGIDCLFATDAEPGSSWNVVFTHARRFEASGLTIERSVRVVDEMEPGDVVKGPLTVACVRRVLERRTDPSRAETTTHRRVLVADDNAINRSVARRLLERLGCTVTLAANGAEAVEAARAHDFDVIFMDCQMPVLDGYDATRAIRAFDGPRSRVPVVAMTANALPGDRHSCLEAGMDDYLAKPVRYEDLAQQLHRLGSLRTDRRSTG